LLGSLLVCEVGGLSADLVLGQFSGHLLPAQVVLQPAANFTNILQAVFPCRSV